MVKPNKDHLEGMRCQWCGSYGPFNITVRLTIPIYDEGFDFPRSEDHTIYWDEDSPCQCNECDYDGNVHDFNVAVETEGHDEDPSST